MSNSKNNSDALIQAKHFIQNETQFHLGILPTEQSNPLTARVDADFRASTAGGIRTLQLPDRDVLCMARRVLAGSEFSKLVDSGEKTLRNGGRIIFSGCGATGRISILLEAMWRDGVQAVKDHPAIAGGFVNRYGNAVSSIMTGGDYALVRSVEFFEDYQEFGRRQVQEMNVGANDMLIAITEGGETSSVLGTVEAAVKLGAPVFLLFNNPAALLCSFLERSRQAITNPGVCVLDLHCGPMAIAGSTRMQATTAEQLIAGAALEIIFSRLLATDGGLRENQEILDFGEGFAGVLDQVAGEEAIKSMAAYIDFEAGIYRREGKLTYFADEFLLDIFTDTTERSPTFMLPPFRKQDDCTSPQSWAFVKNPLYSTQDTWFRCLGGRLPRCLEWSASDYAEMGADANTAANPPAIHSKEIMKLIVGNEAAPCRIESPVNAAVLVKLGGENAALDAAFARAAEPYKERAALIIGGKPAGFSSYVIPFHTVKTPLRLMEHLALKLVLNTVSTGTMICLGRVTGNWMSWVDLSNKKLMDRGTRLLVELCGLEYADACIRLFESMEEVKLLPRADRPSVVQHALAKIGSAANPSGLNSRQK
ncbi:MAG: sugar phosphate isomerase [Verrucomicrobiae bacterium]